MKNITEDQINKVINDAFLAINDNIPLDFVKNFESFKKVLDEGNAFSNDVKRTNASIYFTILKTVQDNCVEILSRSLKELLCDE